jgi:hypothetical protein
MIQKLRKLIIGAAAALALLAPAALPALAHADISDKASCGANLNVDPDCTAKATADKGSGTKLNEIVELVINLFSVIVGVIAVIMIIVGGLKYITSGGDSAGVTSAKNTILYAVVGLIVVALAQFIVRFVLAKVSA